MRVAMDLDAIADAIMRRIEDERAIHRSSIVDEISKAVARNRWDVPTYPVMMTRPTELHDPWQMDRRFFASTCQSKIG